MKNKTLKEDKKLLSEGYDYVEGPWQIISGGRYNEVITEVVIDSFGKGLLVKTSERL